MLSAVLFVLALAAPPSAPGPVAAQAPAKPSAAASELRPVAGIERRAHAQPVAIASASPELREPFGKSRAPVVQGPRPVAPPPAATRSALREPFSPG